MRTLPQATPPSPVKSQSGAGSVAYQSHSILRVFHTVLVFYSRNLTFSTHIFSLFFPVLPVFLIKFQYSLALLIENINHDNDQ
jgi:hypothetical protein